MSWPENFYLNNGELVVLPKIVDESFVNHWKDETFTNADHHLMHEAISSSNLKLILSSPYSYLEHIKHSSWRQQKR